MLKFFIYIEYDFFFVLMFVSGGNNIHNIFSYILLSIVNY
jgi:hypothetical protein